MGSDTLGGWVFEVDGSVGKSTLGWAHIQLNYSFIFLVNLVFSIIVNIEFVVSIIIRISLRVS